MTETTETKSETKKLDLQEIVEVVSEALHKKNQHFVINTETKTVGAFYPSAQSETISSIHTKIIELEARLSALESPRVPEEFQSVERAEQADAPEVKK